MGLLVENQMEKNTIENDINEKIRDNDLDNNKAVENVKVLIENKEKGEVTNKNRNEIKMII